MLHRLFLLAAACFLFAACRKENMPANSQGSSLISAAKTFFTDSIEAQASPSATGWERLHKIPDWDAASVVPFRNTEAVVVPVTYADNVIVSPNFSGLHRRLNLSGLTTLLVYRDPGYAMHAELVTTLPDSAFLSNPSRSFSGFKIIEDWRGNLIARYRYTPGGRVLRFSPPGNTGGGQVATGNHAWLKITSSSRRINI